jgi:hypothetical protein
MGDSRPVYGRNSLVYGRSRQCKRTITAVYEHRNDGPGIVYEIFSKPNFKTSTDHIHFFLYSTMHRKDFLLF